MKFLTFISSDIKQSNLWTTLYNTVQHCTILYNTVQHCKTLYNTVQHCMTLYNPVQHYIFNDNTKIEIRVDSTGAHVFGNVEH